MSATGKNCISPAEEAGEMYIRVIGCRGGHMCFGLAHSANKVRQPPEKTNIIFPMLQGRGSIVSGREKSLCKGLVSVLV